MLTPFNYVTNRHIQTNLYAMKQQYGAPIAIRRRTAQSADPKTGESTSTIQTWRIHRAAVLPGNVVRNAKQSISLIIAQKAMVEGGGFDVGKKTFLIDRRDVPRDFVLQKDDWIVYDKRHFQIDTYAEYEKAAWVIVGKELCGRSENSDPIVEGATSALTVADDSAAASPDPIEEDATSALTLTGDSDDSVTSP